MISVSHLVKRYGSHLAVDDVSFQVDKGEVVGFLGPNGAGKSTTLRILAGFLGATGGQVTVAGHDLATDSMEARRSIGYMPEAVPLYGEMRVHEYLAFRAELKGVPRAKRRARVDEAMGKASVDDVATAVIGKLSKGYRQRVGLADALVANPPILILDEPTAGLDPNQILEVRKVIGSLAADHTVVLSTHILSEVEASCGKVLLIAKGKLLAQGPTRDLARMRTRVPLELRVRGDAATAMGVVEKAPGIRSVKEVSAEGEVITLRVTWSKKAEVADVEQAVEQMVAELVGAGVNVREVRPAGGALEAAFAELTRGGAEEAGEPS